MVHVTLVKLVQIKELRNIWHHVIRKKKFDTKKQVKSTFENKTVQGNRDVCRAHQNTGNRDQNGKLNKKRKDEEDESEDNGHDHEDPTTQIQLNFVLLLLVDNMIIRKRIHVRVEHVQPSRNEEIKHRIKKNDELKAAAKARGEVNNNKRQPEGSKPGFMVEGATLETVTPIPYNVVNDLKAGY